jgi:ATP-dependent DNA ligase I
MLFVELAKLYEKLEKTTKRLEKTFILAKFFKRVKEAYEKKEIDEEEVKNITYLAQGTIFPSYAEEELGISENLLIRAIAKATGVSEEDVEEKWKEIGDLGRTAEFFVSKKKQATLFTRQLTIQKVVENLKKASMLEGEGTIEKKISLVAELLTSASPLESRYIARIILEELRIGVAAGIVRDAIAFSTMPLTIPLFVLCDNCKEIVPFYEYCVNCKEPIDKKKWQNKEEFEKKIKAIKSKNIKVFSNIDEARQEFNKYVELIQHSYDVSANFGEVFLKAIKGIEELKKIDIVVGKPIKVMLALKVNTIAEAFEKVGRPAQIEYKYDGFRVLIHKTKEGKIKIFTRRLDDVTKQFPEIVEYVRKHVDGESFILDGEAVGFDIKTKKYKPFQEISHRIKRKYDIEKLAKELPVEINLFDILYYNGEVLINKPLKERRELLEKIVKPVKWKIVLAKKLITDKEEEAEKFYNEALDVGEEGVMFKNLNAPYKPGARVGYMIKLKPGETSLDLVITGAEWGTGKRAKWLSSFILSCYDPSKNVFLEIGKVGTGIKEKREEGLSFEELTNLLKPLIVEEKGIKVKIKPKVVVEVVYQEIQKSPTYSSGYALRFPRLIRLRPDKAPKDADTIETIKKLYEEQFKKKEK